MRQAIKKIYDATVSLITSSGGVVEQRAKLQKISDVAMSELNDLNTLPAPIEDRLNLARATLNKVAAEAEKRFFRTLLPQLEDPTSTPESLFMSFRPASLQSHGSDGRNLASSTAMHWLLKDQILATVEKAITEGPQPPRVGPPLADRPAMISALEQEIAEITEAIAKIDQQAKAAGVTFSVEA